MLSDILLSLCLSLAKDLTMDLFRSPGSMTLGINETFFIEIHKGDDNFTDPNLPEPYRKAKSLQVHSIKLYL